MTNPKHDTDGTPPLVCGLAWFQQAAEILSDIPTFPEIYNPTHRISVRTYDANPQS
jgi:hypothetical protein